MSSRLLAAPLAAPLAVAVLLAAGCTPDAAPAHPQRQHTTVPGIHLAAHQADCAGLVRELRAAAARDVASWGPGRRDLPDFAGGARAGDPAGAASAAGPPSSSGFSGTNVHEAGADEPDLVKTDGRRIVTVHGGVLRVVDAASRTETGRVDLKLGPGHADLLLAGDRALVLARGHARWRGPADPAALMPAPPGRTDLLLVDLGGVPRVAARYGIDATLVDARLTGTAARVVVRNSPRFTFPRRLPADGPPADRLPASRDAVGAAPVEAWLPRYDLTVGGVRREGHVACDRVRTPPRHTGSSLVTLLTFDLARPVLDDGDPTTVVADGDTVYATPTSLYLTHGDGEDTQILRFDTSGPGTPYRAGGEVPGRLLNQYALSEWNGHLRVATTLGSGDRSSSSLHVLRVDQGNLTEVGAVHGLGRTEQIHAVRFVEDRGYVVTFRRTDPLYAVDLRDPRRPRVTGELKIPGYSAHLQPVGPGRLIGIGQDATSDGRVTGSQVSLFDVGDPARPARLAQHRVADSWSEAENDPHAVLWWPATELLVVPLHREARSTALALRVHDGGLTKAGEIRQRDGSPIRRSLVAGGALWTMSDTGLQVNDLTTLARIASLPA